MKVIFYLILLVICFSYSNSQTEITISNLKPRLDTDGNIIDVHEGCMIQFGDMFYWYGTVYGTSTGYTRNNYFQSYSSKDLMNWKKESVLLVDKPSGMYYRPHVVYNSITKKYILWYNWYSKFWEGRYGVAISDNPVGPFNIQNSDVKVYHSKEGVGDFNIFVDDDNSAYISYTAIQGHKVSVEKLSKDYLSSTLENGGLITEESEALSMFKRNNKYYLLTDNLCCYCTYGSGARVYISDNPLKGYQLRNNINKYPGSLAQSLIDGIKVPNSYTVLKRQKDSLFYPVQINLQDNTQINNIKIYQFTGNRKGVCGDSNAIRVHDEIKIPEFEFFIKQNNNWIKISSNVTLGTYSIYNIINLDFENISTSSILIRPLKTYSYNEILINEIEIFNGNTKIILNKNKPSAFINDVDPKASWPTIIPAQQTYIMPIKTNNGIQFIWIGDLWGSASDNIKGHDYQYWSPPFTFDINGDIEPMEWTDEWKAILIE